MDDGHPHPSGQPVALRFQALNTVWNGGSKDWTIDRHLRRSAGSGSLWGMKTITAPTLILILAVLSAARSDDDGMIARAFLQRIGFSGGLIVHVGCGDGALTAALAEHGRCAVQGLDTQPACIEATRDRLRARVGYGLASAAEWDGRRLPYAENLVTLLVVSDPRIHLAEDEILRVLRPGGVAAVADGEGAWRVTTRPRPAEIGDWPHYLCGADNNAVARDSVVGPPRHMQWVSGPMYARSHEINSSMAAMVASDGRLFTIWDDGPTAIADPRFPQRWSLIARDAFNGMVLWTRPMPDWGWPQWHARSRWDDPLERAKMLRHLPPTLPRRLVGAGERVYVTLGYEAPVSALDAATGDLVREFEGTERTDEILHVNGALILRVRPPDHPPEPDMWGEGQAGQVGFVMAVDAASGGVLWRSAPEPIAPLTLAESGGRVFYSTYERVVCLDLASGRELWRGEPVVEGVARLATGGTLVAQEHVVLYAHTPPAARKPTPRLFSFSAETGALLWSGHHATGPGIANPPDLFVAGGLAWTGETQIPIDTMATELRRQGVDPLTGAVAREIVVPKLISPGHHYRCYRSKAAERFLMLPKRGVEFVDLVGRDHMRHDWLRAPCVYGVLPANGLLYVAPHQCVCYPGVLLANFNALAARADIPTGPESPESRLRTGPAVDEPAGAAAAGPEADGDWPAYRRDILRSGRAATAVPEGEGLTPRWECRLSGALTPPVVAGGRLLVAEKDAHTIHALDAGTGRAAWRFTAGGRIDSPPAIHGPRVLFGSADGWVYCLRLEDGREIWRFRAAPHDRRIAAFGQVESAWPVHGSVLVQKDATVSPARDVVYFTAGRSSFLDGGIHVYGLDPATGAMLHHARLDGPRPDPYEDVGGAGYMDGAKSDLLTSDGADIFLFQERFRSDLQRFPEPMQNLSKEGGGFRIFPPAPERGSSGRRLITSSGFLDDTFNEGAYWTYSSRWAGWDRSMRTVPVFGHLLVFDDRTAYGMQANYEKVRVRRGMTPGGKGYRIFARDHDAEKERWTVFVPLRVRAMVLADDTLFIAGPPDLVPEDDPLAALDGRLGASIWALNASNGEKRSEVAVLSAPPVFDGLIAALGRLYVSTTDGRVVCFGK